MSSIGLFVLGAVSRGWYLDRVWHAQIESAGLVEKREAITYFGITLGYETWQLNGSHVRLNEKSLFEILGSPQLLDLFLTDVDITIPVLPRTSALRHLSLDRCSIGDAGLRNLESWHTLRALHLTNMHWNVGDLVAIESLPIGCLSLDGTKLTSEDFQSVGKLTELGTLGLDACVLPDHGIEFLANLPKLRRIHMVDVEIQPSHIEGLLKLPHLELVVVRTSRQGEFIDVAFRQAGRQDVSQPLE